MKKKNYVVPQMKAFKVLPATILAGSTNSTTSTQNEEYETSDTSSWF